MNTISAVMRKERKKKVKRLRREQQVPGVIYGKDTASLPITIDGRALARLLRKEASSGLWEIKVEHNGDPQTHLVVVQEVQRHILTHEVIHIDFHAVKRGEKATFHVPVQLVGSPKGVKTGGILEQHLREVEVECLPKFLPGKIEVDVSELELGYSVKVADLTMPEGVHCLADAKELVAIVAAPSKVEEAVKAEEEVAEEIAAEGEEAKEEPAKEEPGKEDTAKKESK